jgi:hypothetical protein
MRSQTGILAAVHPVLRGALRLRNSSCLAQRRIDNLMNLTAGSGTELAVRRVQGVP